MAATFTFSLIAPERVLATHPATMVTLPGSDGMLGVLPGHVPLVVALKPGVVTIVNGISDLENAIELVFVGGGFAEIKEDSLTIIADEAAKVSELDVLALTDELEKLENELSIAANDADQISLRQALTMIQAKLFAARDIKAAA